MQYYTVYLESRQGIMSAFDGGSNVTVGTPPPVRSPLAGNRFDIDDPSQPTTEVAGSLSRLHAVHPYLHGLSPDRT